MLEKVVIAAVAGLFGLMPLALQWLSARRKTKSYEHKLSALSCELDFLVKLMNLSSQELENDSSQASSEMTLSIRLEAQRIFADYRSLQQTETKAKSVHTVVPLFRRCFLLFQPTSTKVWLIHSSFYVLMIFAISMVISEYQSPTFDPETGENNFTNLLIGTIVIFGPIIIYLQRVAMRHYRGKQE
ncbi:MAG: hypothetical protein V7784_11425 [Oceanospirillaceae bacterium]